MTITQAQVKARELAQRSLDGMAVVVIVFNARHNNGQGDNRFNAVDYPTFQQDQGNGRYMALHEVVSNNKATI